MSDLRESMWGVQSYSCAVCGSAAVTMTETTVYADGTTDHTVVPLRCSNASCHYSNEALVDYDAFVVA